MDILVKMNSSIEERHCLNYEIALSNIIKPGPCVGTRVIDWGSFIKIVSNVINNIIGANFGDNTIEDGFNSNTIGLAFYKNHVGFNFTSNDVGELFVKNTIADNFQHNEIKDNSCNTIDFTSATLVYQPFDKEIRTMFKAPNTTAVKLMYWDADSNMPIFANITD